MWHFPLINPRLKFSNAHYLWHIVLEIVEFVRESDPEKKEKEAVDILHASETFVRKYFKDDSEFEYVKAKVIAKNLIRGYYKN
jgi:hypothetical protein